MQCSQIFTTDSQITGSRNYRWWW